MLTNARTPVGDYIKLLGRQHDYIYPRLLWSAAGLEGRPSIAKGDSPWYAGAEEEIVALEGRQLCCWTPCKNAVLSTEQLPENCLKGARMREVGSRAPGTADLAVPACNSCTVAGGGPLLVSYFRNRLTRRVGFRREWIVALAIAGVVFAGTRAGVPPFSTLLAFSERFKQSWEDPRSAAPIPHAELLTVQEFAEKAGIPLETAMERLSNRELTGVAPEIVVAELASRNDLSAQRLYEIMRDAPARTGNPGPGHADEKAAAKGAAGGHRGGGGWGAGGGAGGGPGRMTLSEYCDSRGLDVQDVQARLQAQGIQLTAGRTLREIASDNGYDRPSALLEIIEGRNR